MYSIDGYVKNLIISCIDRTGYIEAGHLKYFMDTKLSSNSDNLIFTPCDIRDGIMVLFFKQRGSDYLNLRTYNIEHIIQEYLQAGN